jgi:hypothetical protein
LADRDKYGLASSRRPSRRRVAAASAKRSIKKIL